MRSILIVSMLAGCGEPKLVMKPLPPLAAPQPAAREIVVRELGLAPGEHFVWDVQVRGFSIGRAELTAGDAQIASHFKTSALASMVAVVEHELVTLVDRAAARPQTSTERLELAGKLRQFSTQFEGTKAHSFHSALGAIRAWAHADASPGYLDVVHADQMFRFELEQPVARSGTLRIDGKVRGPEIETLSLTIWLDASRVPIRIEIRDGEDRVTAELIAS